MGGRPTPCPQAPSPAGRPPRTHRPPPGVLRWALWELPRRGGGASPEGGPEYPPSDPTQKSGGLPVWTRASRNLSGQWTTFPSWGQRGLRGLGGGGPGGWADPSEALVAPRLCLEVEGGGCPDIERRRLCLPRLHPQPRLEPGSGARQWALSLEPQQRGQEGAPPCRPPHLPGLPHAHSQALDTACPPGGPGPRRALSLAPPAPWGVSTATGSESHSASLGLSFSEDVLGKSPCRVELELGSGQTAVPRSPGWGKAAGGPG